MEINYRSVKALSSPTRLKILQSLLKEPSTPTEIAKNIGKSKSTVVGHLTKLSDADLVEKDSEKGRRRVVYSPTRKAKAIANGSKRKVSFTIFSSALTTALGAGIVVQQMLSEVVDEAAEPEMMMETAETAAATTQETGNPLIIALGISLIILGLLTLTYFSYFKKKLMKE